MILEKRTIVYAVLTIEIIKNHKNKVSRTKERYEGVMVGKNLDEVKYCIKNDKQGSLDDRILNKFKIETKDSYRITNMKVISIHGKTIRLI